MTESCWQDGLRSIDGKHIALSLDSLDPGAVSESWLEGHQSFVSLRMRVLEALRDQPDGPIAREAMADRAYSKMMLEQIEDAPDAKRRAKNLRKLHAILCREVRHYAPEGRTLVVAQLNIEEALPSVGPLPPGADIVHHNAVAGRDEWRDVRNLIGVTP